MGLRNRRVQAALARYGLTQEHVTRGHQLLRAATLATLTPRSLPKNKSTKLLDEFENLWFPIVRATLANNLPDIGEWLFANLAQTEGLDVVTSVGAFVQRLELLASGDSPFEGRGVDAVALLAERSFDDQVLSDVREILDGLSDFEPSTESSVEADVETAETEMWSWYLEWSTIARTVIKERSLLRALGFLKASRRSGSDDEADDAAPEEDSEEEAQTTA